MADAPEAGGLSLADLVATAKQVWQAFVLPATIAGWGAYRWLATRKDRLADGDRKERADVRSTLGARETAFMDRIERESARKDVELDQERRRNAELERRLEETLDYARGWKVRASDLRHGLRGARATINMLLVGAGKPERDWPDDELPVLEAIVADNARRSAAREAERKALLERP